MPADAAAPSPSVLDLQRRIDELDSKLRESESRHSLVSDAVAEGIYEWNVECNTLWVSQRLIEIFGFEGRELKAEDWNKLVHPEDFPAYKSALSSCFKGTSRRLDCEYRVMHADGSYRWIEDRAVPVRNVAGRAIRLVGAVSDVTTRKEGDRALREALEQQTAATEVLEVINSSPGNLAPVFDVMLDKALGLCRASIGILFSHDGQGFRVVAHQGASAAFIDFMRGRYEAGPETGLGRLRSGEQVVHIADLKDTEAYRSGEPLRRATVDIAGARGWLGVALRKDQAVRGAIVLYRQDAGYFSEKQVALLQGFAAQAVIAMENARLLTEQRDALEQQTATADILRIISQSPTDVRPVLNAVAKAAIRFCGAEDALISLRDREEWFIAGHEGPISHGDERRPLNRGTAVGRAILDGKTVHLADIPALDPEDFGAIQEFARREGFTAAIAAPLLREGAAVGSISLRRAQPGAFSQRQIELLENFAAQAVIALENTRLFTELKESLDYQTATSEVLKVISRSTEDLQPVLDAMVAAAIRLCSAQTGGIAVRRVDKIRFLATVGQTPEFERHLQTTTYPIDRSTAVGRVVLDKAVYHSPDIAADPTYTRREASTIGRQRAVLGVPLMRQGEAVGVIVVSRADPIAFTERQIGLIKTFADQAVIAMENTRLITEQREALEQQTGTAEVLQVINSSPGDLQPVFEAMLEKAMRLCGAAFGDLRTYDGKRFHMVASQGVPVAYSEYYRNQTGVYGPGTAPALILAGEDVVHVPDLLDTEPYRRRDPDRVALVELGGARTSLTVPLRKAKEVVGFIMIYRQEAKAFDEKQVALLQNFAAQAVIAMENARLLTETREALERQTATSEVLQVINSTPGDVQPVFEVILAKAMTLCDAVFGTFAIFDGERLHTVATHGVPEAFAQFRRSNPPDYGPGTGPGRLIAGEDCVHDIDAADSEAYRRGDPSRRAIVDLGGARTILNVALRKDGVLLGGISIYRQQVRPFSNGQIALLQGFASQAVIAMDNARLLGELTRREEELRVTFDNMGDGVVMFDADLRLASWNRNFQQLLDVPDRFLAGRPGLEDYVRLLVQRGELGDRDPDKEVARYRDRAARQWSTERTRPDGRVLEVRNNPVPGGGAVLIYSDITKRKQAEAEIRAARDAAEAALERQTATGDILRVIASSPSDVQPVFDAIAERSNHLIGGLSTAVYRFADDMLYLMSLTPISVQADAALKALFPMPLSRSASFEKSIRTRDVYRVSDAEVEFVEDPDTLAMARLRGWRSVVLVPLIEEGEPIGIISVTCAEPGSIADEHVELLKTFADQAVIAIRNARLFNELRESLEQQTATSEILQVISQSPTDVKPVLDAVANAALRFCGANDVQVCLREADNWFVAVHLGPLGSKVGERRVLNRETGPGRAIADGKTVHLGDVQGLDPVDFAEARKLGRALGFNSALCAPMMRDDVAVGAISLRRPQTGSYSDRQVALLESFAAQAVIAIENVRLFTELRDSLERLKAAQANLVQSEKMASLGQLTAGIAHEIKNPLNFVNNFAGLSSELLDELKQAVEAMLTEPNDDKRAELQDTMDLLTGNLAKILEHGRRADGIVKSMLAHSRGGTGDWQTSNINGLVEEALNLAYHGARAQDQSFNVTLERDLDDALRPIDVVPQDVTRVFLNLFSNGFYATRKRQREGADSDYRPMLKIATRDFGEAVEVRVRDNGIGISAEVRDKLFQPFFTTKPTGEGTGLGLSISYDIVTQQHGGSIEVESEVGQYTEFTVRLPRARRAVA